MKAFVNFLKYFTLFWCKFQVFCLLRGEGEITIGPNLTSDIIDRNTSFSRENNTLMDLKLKANANLVTLYLQGGETWATFFFVNSSSSWEPEESASVSLITGWSNGKILISDFLKGTTTDITPPNPFQQFRTMNLWSDGSLIGSSTLPQQRQIVVFPPHGERRWKQKEITVFLPPTAIITQVLQSHMDVANYKEYETGIITATSTGGLYFTGNDWPRTHLRLAHLGLNIDIAKLQEIKVGKYDQVILASSFNPPYTWISLYPRTGNFQLIRNPISSNEFLQKTLIYNDLKTQSVTAFFCGSQGVFSFNLSAYVANETEVSWKTLKRMDAYDCMFVTHANGTEMLVASHFISLANQPLAELWNLQNTNYSQSIIRRNPTWYSSRVLEMTFNYRQNPISSSTSILEGVPVLIFSLDENNIDEYELTDQLTTTRLCSIGKYGEKLFFFKTNLTNLKEISPFKPLPNPMYNTINLGINFVDGSLRYYRDRTYLKESLIPGKTYTKLIARYISQNYAFNGEESTHSGYSWVATGLSVVEFYWRNRDSKKIPIQQQCEWVNQYRYPAPSGNCCRFEFEAKVPSYCQSNTMQGFILFMNAFTATGFYTLQSPVSYVRIKHEIDNNRPVILGLSNSGEEFLQFQVIIGYEQSGDERISSQEKCLLFIPEASKTSTAGVISILYDELLVQNAYTYGAFYWTWTIFTRSTM